MGWLDSLQEAKNSGVPGAVLSFNVGDRVFDHIAGAPHLASLRWFLAARFAAEGYRVGYFSLARGFTELRPPGAAHGPSPLEALGGKENPQMLLRGLDGILKDSAARVVVIIDYAEHLTGSASEGHAGLAQEQAAVLETLHEWSLDDDIRASGNFLILLSQEGALPELLRHESGYRLIPVGLPDEATRLAFTQYLLEAREQGFQARLGSLEQGFSVAEFARATGGLRLRDIEGLLGRAAALKTTVNREQVRDCKRETIGRLCHGLLEVIEPMQGFEAVAGCRAAKEYFEAMKPLWAAGHRSLPQGVLLAGVPGSGKSFLVKALARELSTPCLALRSVREQWVGASERNMERILQVVENLAPCIFWTDEVDQQVGGERSAGPSGDSGVNQRLFGRLLEFFGDARIRGRVLWIATTNRPDLLDVAIQDRFSIKIPFLHPTRRERAELLPVLASQIGRTLAPGIDCEAVAADPKLELISVRALQEIVVAAGTRADLRGPYLTPGRITAIDQGDLVEAVEDYKPCLDPLEHTLIALTALNMTAFHSLLPWMGLRGYRKEQAEWPPYLDELVDRETGKLDHAELERQIQQVRQHRMARRAEQ